MVFWISLKKSGLIITVARLESGIRKDPGVASASVHLVFVLSASETGLLLGVKLRRNVVMMLAGVKIVHQSNARRPLNYRAIQFLMPDNKED